MAIFDTISFPDIDFVTGNPTIDGWTGNTDPGVAVHFPESGYAVGGRVSFDGGSLVPPVAFTCTRVQIASGADVGLPSVPAGSYLAMGFFCTFDPTFDAADGITLAFLPDFATKTHTTARRIDLLPNTDGVGAGPPGGGVDPILASVGGRLNRDLAASPAFWKGIGANNPPPAVEQRWDSIVVNNVYTKAASWIPASLSLTAAGGQTVPTTTVSASAPFTLTVIDDISNDSDFPTAGDLLVSIVGNPAVTVAYTGKNAGTKTFTGCTVRKMTTGGPVDTVTGGVQRLDVGWSVEVLIPTTQALGGADWINLTGHFGLYINLFRFSMWQPQPPATTHAGFLAAQYRFPIPDPTAPLADQHYLAGFLDDTPYIGDSWYGRGSIPQMLGGVNDAVGVCFENVPSPASSVGVRHGADPTLTQYIYGSSGTEDNTIVARVKNTDTTSVANDVTAEFRFGKWGNPPTAFAQWDASTVHGATTPNIVDLAAGGAVKEITSFWDKDLVGTVYQGDRCMWVRLDSTSAVNFAQAGVRRNIIFTQLSEHSEDATISGSGYPTPASGHHDFLLLPHVRALVALKRDGEALTHATTGAFAGGEGPMHEDVLGYYWLVETFRRTGLEFTVGDSKAEVIDPSPGQFGALARHDEDSDVFMTALWGGGLQRSGNAYELRVPHNGEVTIHTWMGAGPPGTVKPPKGATGQGGCLGLLLPFLNWIRNLLK
jgi:hypothetical protein